MNHLVGVFGILNGTGCFGEPHEVGDAVLVADEAGARGLHRNKKEKGISEASAMPNHSVPCPFQCVCVCVCALLTRALLAQVRWMRVV